MDVVVHKPFKKMFNAFQLVPGKHKIYNYRKNIWKLRKSINEFLGPETTFTETSTITDSNSVVSKHWDESKIQFALENWSITLHVL